MVLRPGSMEIGEGRTDLTEFCYVAGEMILPPRHEGKWVGLSNAPYLQLSISDVALTAPLIERWNCACIASLRTLACVGWLRPFMQRWRPGFRAGGCFWILLNRP